MKTKRIKCTWVSLILYDGAKDEAVYGIYQGTLRGRKGRRYADINAPDTTCVAKVSYKGGRPEIEYKPGFPAYWKLAEPFVTEEYPYINYNM